MRHKTNTITVKQGLMIIAMAVIALIILNVAERISFKVSKTVKNWTEDISIAKEDIQKAKNSGKISSVLSTRLK